MTGKSGYGKYLKVSLTVGDYVILNLAYLLTLWIAGPDSHFYSRWVWLIANVSFIPSVWFYSGTHNDRLLFADKVVLTAFKSIVVQSITMICLLYLFDIFNVSTGVSLLFLGIFWLLLSAWWVFSRWILKKFRRMGFNFRRAVVVGTGPTTELLINDLKSDAGYGFRIFGVFDNLKELRSNATTRGRKNIQGYDIRDISLIPNFVAEQKIDIIYYTKNAEDLDEISALMSVADEHGAEFVYVPPFNKILLGQFKVSSIGTLPSMVYSMSPLHHTRNKIAKRILDLAISIPFLIVSPVIFVPIAIAIKATSKGPIFFKQKRTGIHGSEFVCYKFRTMKVNDESDTRQATEDDPRKTKLGDFLRRTSLDELPQFFNVFLGNMSVVGPRPHMISHTEEYSALIEQYMVRHAVKPGITGWAQINGYRGGTKHLWQMQKRVEYDVWYIRNWNLMLDLKVIFLTAFNSLRTDENAY